MRRHVVLLATASVFGLAGCETYEAYEGVEATAATEVEEVDQEVEVEVESETLETEQEYVQTDAEKLQDILDDQPGEVKARYGARHPAETLTFFGIEPGMNVMEALPGGGWYSKILMAYLGPDSRFTGAHYPDEIWEIIIPGADEERLAGFAARTAAWPEQAAGWGIENSPEIQSYQLTKADPEKSDLFDAALFIRALHNLNRSEAVDGYLSTTIAETYRLLRPGGVVGVVQHRAPEEASDAWADGNAGYLKQSFVIDAFETAGFVFEEASEINANPADQAGDGDVVWRLPPTLAGTEADTPEQAAMLAIGESDRMTLRFRKPD